MQKTQLVHFKQAMLTPEVVWQEQSAQSKPWQQLLKSTILPTIVVVGIVSALLTKLFGYHIPIVGVIRPTMGDMLLQGVGTIVIYTVSVVILGWFAAWLAGTMGGRNEMDRGVAMLFWTSVPSLAGQLLSPIPMVGWVIGLGLGLYTLVLLYKAIPVFLDVSLESRGKHFLLFLIGSIAFSILLNISVGKLFEPKGMFEEIQQSIPLVKERKVQSDSGEKHSPDTVIREYLDSMMGGDYGQKVIEESAKDRFDPPKDNLLTPRQVEEFVKLAQKVTLVRKEQARALKEKYDKFDKQEEPSFADIFNGLKDLSGIATLEMKVVKSNGGNWAEYQWVKDRIREAYYTPSLNDATKKNSELIEKDRAVIAEVL
jgi:hypothetical protein